MSLQSPDSCLIKGLGLKSSSFYILFFINRKNHNYHQYYNLEQHNVLCQSFCQNDACIITQALKSNRGFQDKNGQIPKLSIEVQHYMLIILYRWRHWIQMGIHFLDLSKERLMGKRFVLLLLIHCQGATWQKNVQIDDPIPWISMHTILFIQSIARPRARTSVVYLMEIISMIVWVCADISIWLLNMVSSLENKLVHNISY